MSRSDQWVNIILATLIVLYLAIWLIGYWSNKLHAALTFLNLLSALLIIVYWEIKQMNITQHIIEGREIFVLGFEVLVIGCAVYSMVTGYSISWLKVIQYIFFGMHFSVLLLGLAFILTFKINKLM